MMSSWAVMIPLHSDATVFGGKELYSEDLGSCMDGIEGALADWLAPVVGSEWPELRLLYMDCMLTNVQSADPKSIQFKKARGELTLGSSIDCEPLFRETVEAQVIAIFKVIALALGNAFEKFKKPGLLASLSAFKRQLDVDFVRAHRKLRDLETDDDLGDDLPPTAFPADSEGRVRSADDLPRKKGVLWVMLKVPSAWSSDDLISMVTAIERYVLEHDLGDADGSSFGTSVCDASFDVRNLSRASKAMDAYLRKAFPDVDFVISDDYEVVFSDPG